MPTAWPRRQLYQNLSRNAFVLPLYPEMERFLRLKPEVDPKKVGVQAFRDMFREETRLLPKENVEEVEDVSIPGSEGEIHAKVYRPTGTKNSGGVVYLHGGGFVMGDVESYDPFSRALANASGCLVLSVDYRLAPEHKFPAAVTDSFDAVSWAVRNSSKLGMTKGVAVAGDSAGGNLAAVSALMCREKKVELKAQVMVFPFIAFDVVSRSSVEYTESRMLPKGIGAWFDAQYLNSPQDVLNPKFSPILWGNFENLPPALVVTAEYDPLRDSGEAYADTLAKDGVAVTSIRVRGVSHGFTALLGIGWDTFAMIGGYLNRRFQPQLG